MQRPRQRRRRRVRRSAGYVCIRVLQLKKLASFFGQSDAVDRVSAVELAVDDEGFLGLSAQLGSLTRGQRRRLRSALATLERATLAPSTRQSARPAADTVPGAVAEADGIRGSHTLGGGGMGSASRNGEVTVTRSLVLDADCSDLHSTDHSVGDPAARPVSSPRAEIARDGRQETARRGLDAFCHHCGGTDLRPLGRIEPTRARRHCPACRRTRLAPEETAAAALDPMASAPEADLRREHRQARLRLPDKFEQVRDDMLTNRPPSACRDLAASLDIDKMTAWRWRRRIFRAMETTMPRPTPGPKVAVSDTAWVTSPPLATKRVRESRKGSRQWVAHRHDPVTCPAPDRPRWVDVDHHGEPLPRPLWTYQHIVLLGFDQAGSCRTEIVAAGPPAAAASAGNHDPRHRRARQDEPLHGAGAWRGGLGALVPLAADHPQNDAGALIDACSRKAATDDGDTPAPSATRFPAAAMVANPNEPSSDRLDICFERFLRQFRGPAAANLGGYAAWYAARLDHAGRDHQALPPAMASDPRQST